MAGAKDLGCAVLLEARELLEGHIDLAHVLVETVRFAPGQTEHLHRLHQLLQAGDAAVDEEFLLVDGRAQPRLLLLAAEDIDRVARAAEARQGRRNGQPLH